MRRAFAAALAIAIASATISVNAQELEITVGGGLGLESFYPHVLTYPTADVGLTRWWASGWGLGGRGTFGIGTVLHPRASRAWASAEPHGTRFIGVSATTRAALLARRRWSLRGTEIDVAIGWSYFRHTDRTLQPDGSIGKFTHDGYPGRAPSRPRRRCRRHGCARAR